MRVLAGAHETNLDELKTIITLVLTFNIYYCYDSSTSKAFVLIPGVMRLWSLRLVSVSLDH